MKKTTITSINRQTIKI